MGLLNKLFRKNKSQSQTNTHQLEDRVEISAREKNAPYTYKNFTAGEHKNVQKSVAFLAEGFASLLQFEKTPAFHPENLDEYLDVLGSAKFGDFMGVPTEQHIAIIAYNFGEYLVQNYNMQWQVKADEQGEQTVVRMTTPFEIELYPVDSTLDAIKNKKEKVYTTIEQKLKRALDLLDK